MRRIWEQPQAGLHGGLVEEFFRYKRNREFPRFMRTPVVREIYLRLSSDRIPTHPLDASDGKTIEEALEALCEFSRLYDVNDARGGTHMPLILQSFPDIWEWLVFLLPTSNNIRHTRNPKRDVLDKHNAYLNDDGTVEVGLHSSFLTFITFVKRTLCTEEGRAACLAQPDFFWALLELNFPPIHTVPPDVAFLSHCLSEELNDLRLDQRYSRRAMSSLVAHDEENPGGLSRAMVERLAWLLNGPREDQNFIPVYIDLVYCLLSTDRAVANFRRARGVTLVVTVLGKAVASPGVLEDQHRTSLNEFFMTCLHYLLLLTNTNGPIIEALDAGLLHNLGMLATGLPGGIFAAEDYRELANMLIRMILAPALLWPDVVRAFHRAIESAHILCDPRALIPRWEELGLLYYRYHGCYTMLTKFRADRKKLQYCHHAQCQGQDERAHRVCSCGEAFYCSKACQKAHWHAEHRVKCSRGMKDALQRATTSTPVKVGPDTVGFESDTVPMTYMERAFIRRCTANFDTQPVDGLRLVPHGLPDPAEGKAFLLDWNCGQVGAKIRGIEDWLPQPSENGLPMVRVYSRISKGYAQSVVLADIIHRKPADKHCPRDATRGGDVVEVE
ncbi:hypothetical protein BD626DRAFT_583743 [Schizophyllum amplum]|uniref:MYND-type domain-containing protein n=1 Tax=Schizophyllum amplum TaxID=97359 RepID=A0A550CDG6_9AGAR|nr:hypothetical protein BD626DRAFT_583743 [Auriculariopsis ampla]